MKLFLKVFAIVFAGAVVVLILMRIGSALHNNTRRLQVIDSMTRAPIVHAEVHKQKCVHYFGIFDTDCYSQSLHAVEYTDANGFFSYDKSDDIVKIFKENYLPSRISPHADEPIVMSAYTQNGRSQKASGSFIPNVEVVDAEPETEYWSWMAKKQIAPERCLSLFPEGELRRVCMLYVARYKKDVHLCDSTLYSDFRDACVGAAISMKSSMDDCLTVANPEACADSYKEVRSTVEGTECWTNRELEQFHMFQKSGVDLLSGSSASAVSGKNNLRLTTKKACSSRL